MRVSPIYIIITCVLVAISFYAGTQRMIAYYENPPTHWDGLPVVVKTREFIITLGPDEYPKCQTDIRLSVWDEMNAIGIYRWTAVCEDLARGGADLSDLPD